MNIKNPEAHALAAEIAQATGESITATVLRALRELKRRELKPCKTREEKQTALDAAFARHARDAQTKGKDPGDDLLFDAETGLPR